MRPKTDAIAGMIQGKPFAPDKITLQGSRLSFRQGKEFFADMEITFSLPDEKRKEARGHGVEVWGQAIWRSRSARIGEGKKGRPAEY
jgi:hypothetical protein